MAAKRKSTRTGAEQDDTSLSPIRWVERYWRAIRMRIDGLLVRRPHRSFRRTYRRDYVRSLRLPGYWAFSGYVLSVILKQKRVFLFLALFYGVLSFLLVGLASQNAYMALADTLRETGSELFTGGWGELGRTTLLLASGLTGNWNEPLTEAEQIYVVFIGLLTWLTAVWLLRAMLAGGKPRLRDGLYSSGAPIVPTFIVCLVVLLQLAPVALSIVAFTSAVATGLITSGGVEAMLFWVVITLLVGLSLYWITSTLIALVVVTLPGMYPLKAIQTAGDLAIGRRVRLLLRLLWLGLTIGISWLIIMVPIMLIDAWVKSVFIAIEWIPVVPVAMMIMSSLTIVWAASYVYLLYRKVVDDDAAPA